MAASTRGVRSRVGLVVRVAALVAVVAAGAAPAPADEGGSAPPSHAPAVVAAAATLDVAVAAGLLEVEGRHPQGCVRVELVLASRSDEPLTLDVAGRHLRPTTGRVQRLGLSHPVGPVTPLPGHGPGVFAVRLAPRETRRVLMNSCCMDLGIADPKPHDRFVLADEPPPPAVETALRWWVDHPRVPQRLVNEAIWKEDPALLDRLWDDSVDPRARPRIALPRGDAVRSHGGVLHVRDDRVLVRVDPDGSGHILETGVLEAFPGATDVIVQGKEGLRRVDADGEDPSVPLFEVGAPRVLDLWSVPRGPYVWRTARGVFLRSAADGETQELFAATRSRTLRLCAVDAAAGTFVVIEREKGPSRLVPTPARWFVHDVDARAGRTEVRAAAERMHDLAAGPAGVFGVRLDGVLERVRERAEEPFAGGKVPTRHSGFVRVLGVGRKRLVLQRDDGDVGVLELPWDGWTVLGRASKTNDEIERWRLSLDPVTDDVVWVSGRFVRRLPRYATQPEGPDLSSP